MFLNSAARLDIHHSSECLPPPEDQDHVQYSPRRSRKDCVTNLPTKTIINHCPVRFAASIRAFTASKQTAVPLPEVNRIQDNHDKLHRMLPGIQIT